MSQQLERGEYQELADNCDLPESIVRSLTENKVNSTRNHTAYKSYVNYISCQFFTPQGLIKVGRVDEAQRRVDILLVDILKRLPDQNHSSVFTVALAKLLCHRARGDPEVVAKLLV